MSEMIYQENSFTSRTLGDEYSDAGNGLYRWTLQLKGDLLELYLAAKTKRKRRIFDSCDGRRTFDLHTNFDFIVSRRFRQAIEQHRSRFPLIIAQITLPVCKALVYPDAERMVCGRV